MLGEDGLGVKLHALNGQGLVSHAHDFAVLGPGRELKLGRTTSALDGQRVVAVDGELRGQTGKNTLLRGADHAGLAVHQLLCANDLAAESRAYRLVAQADLSACFSTNSIAGV